MIDLSMFAGLTLVLWDEETQTSIWFDGARSLRWYDHKLKLWQGTMRIAGRGIKSTASLAIEVAQDWFAGGHIRVVVARFKDGDVRKLSCLTDQPLYYTAADPYDSRCVLCPCCAARAEQNTEENLAITGAAVNFENEELTCDECNEEIPCAYPKISA